MGHSPFQREPATLEQLPQSAAFYYNASLRSDLFDFEYLGKDECNRRVYQLLFEGEPWGGPRALLTFREYTTKVKEYARLHGNMGVQRWTDPSGDVGL